VQRGHDGIQDRQATRLLVLSRVLGALGVVLLLAAAALGLQSVTAVGEDCGSTFQPAHGITPLACDDKLSSRGTAVAASGGIGAVGVAASISMTFLRERRENG
jgi:hypothetical protein